MTMSIGELARRLRVTPRTLRHYEDVALLAPETVDPRTGYRSYGPRQLARGIQIEQLKAAGLPLAAIRVAVDGDRPEAALRQRRDEITALLAEHHRQLATIDAILVTRSGLAAPEVVRAGAVHAVRVRVTSDPDALGRTIRRTVQRLRRRVPGGDGSFSARFPLEVGDGPVVVDVAAHLDGPAPGSVCLAPETRISVELAGPVTLLPLAYDALLETARQRGLDLGDAAIEHYLDLGAVGRTEIAIPLRERAGAAGGGAT